MNTAARMESTGQKNRIQISQLTAALLIEAGKEHWFITREKLVAGKGKGQLQMYWVKQGRVKQGEANDHKKTRLMMNEVERYVSTKTSAPAEYELDKADRTEAVGDWIKTSMMTLESTIDSPLAGDKTAQLVDWDVDILIGLLSKIVKKRERTMPVYTGGCTVERLDKHSSGRDGMDCNTHSFRLRIDERVRLELHDFVTQIASQYRDVPFHNFEHASHVAMTANNLMKRITDRDNEPPRKSTFGIRSDPMAHFAVVFSALVHDDHKGLSNDGQVTSEHEETKSTAKPSSMELTWELLMEPRYKHLQSCIYADAFERDRFRQFLINCVKATDITDMELRAPRKKRWNSAFNSASLPTSLTPQEINSRKATIVVELVMQTASAAHYSQHWEMFQKWNELLFAEMYQAYRKGRSDRDPSMGWYFRV